MLSIVSQYPDTLKSLQGLITIPVDEVHARPPAVVYCRRYLTKRGIRYFAGTIADRGDRGVLVWVSKIQRKQWFPANDVFLLVAQ